MSASHVMNLHFLPLLLWMCGIWLITAGLVLFADDQNLTPIERDLHAGTSEIQKSTTICLATIGPFHNKKPWFLSVNSAGKAHLIIETHPQTSYDFVIEKTKMIEIEEMIQHEKFFSLKPYYGIDATDTAMVQLTIVSNTRVNTVCIRYLMNWINDPSALKEPARAVRIALMIRSCFHYPEAIDFSDSDRQVLESVQGGRK